MLNLLLALFMSLALSINGAAGVPALPEIQSTNVIRNITVGFNGESVTLNPEIEFTSALGQEQSTLHFEIRSGDKVLLPMSLEVNSDLARLAVMNSGRVYTVTDNALMGILMQGADGKTIAQMKETLTKVADLVVNTSSAEAQMLDGELRERYDAIFVEELLKVSGGTAEETQVEVEGTSYPARRMEMKLDMEMVMQAIQAMTACEDADVAAIAQMHVAAAMGAEELSDLEELFPGLSGFAMLSDDAGFTPALLTSEAEEEEESSSILPNIEYELELVIAEAEGVDYVQYTYSANDLDSVSTEKASCEEIELGEVYRDKYSSLTTMSDATEVLTEYDLQSGFAEDGSETVTGNYNIEYSGKDGLLALGGDSYRFVCAGTLDGRASSDDEFELSLEFDLTDHTDDEVVNFGHITGSYSQVLTGENTATGRLEAALDLKDDEMDHQLSFSCDIDYADTALVDYFAGQEMKLEPEGGNGMTMLRLEALGMAANVTTLGAEESVLQLAKLFEEDGPALLRALGLSPYMTMTKTTESVEIHRVRTLEEAQRIYLGKLPVFTPPEGYELEYIEVGSSYYSACYVMHAENEDDEKWFFVDVDSYGREDSEFSVRFATLLEDGTVQDTPGNPLEIYTNDQGRIQHLLITREDMYVYVIFDEGGATAEEMQTLLTGFGPGTL